MGDTESQMKKIIPLAYTAGGVITMLLTVRTIAISTSRKDLGQLTETNWAQVDTVRGGRRGGVYCLRDGPFWFPASSLPPVFSSEQPEEGMGGEAQEEGIRMRTQGLFRVVVQQKVT